MTHSIELAACLFANGDLPPGRAAKLAGMTLAGFLAYASAQGIAVVDYDPAELAEELTALQTQPLSP